MVVRAARLLVLGLALGVAVMPAAPAAAAATLLKRSGSNLMGATIGGFCEYLGMWIGSEALSYIVIAAYIASLSCVMLSRRKLPSVIPAPAAV